MNIVALNAVAAVLALCRFLLSAQGLRVSGCGYRGPAVLRTVMCQNCLTLARLVGLAMTLVCQPRATHSGVRQQLLIVGLVVKAAGELR